MRLLTAIVLLILIIIIVVWFTHYLHKNGKLPNGTFKDTYEQFVNSANYKYDEYFTDPSKLYDKIIGYEFNDNIKLALDKAKKKDEMYTTNEQLGTMSAQRIGDATNNSFILANLYNFNVAPNGPTPNEQKTAKETAARFFTKTLSRIQQNPKVVVAATPPIPIEFMVDRAEDFYVAHQQAAPAEVPNFNQIRDTIRTARLQVHPEQPRVITQVEYYQGQPIPNDRQNVHDTVLNKEMKDIYNIVKEKNEMFTFEPKEDDIRNEILKHGGNEDKKGRALRVFERMTKPNYISSLDDTENNVLLNIWKRIHDPENEEHKSSLKEALVDSLSEGVENNTEICVTGRCAHALSTLTLLDKDPNLSKPMKTREILRGEAFLKASQIIKSTLAETDKQTVDAYQGVLPVAQDIEPKVTALERNLVDKIDETLRKDYADVKPDILEEIIKDAKAGV
jgi:hypothetical protein